MADLYFKIRADYEELVRMQEEADRLKTELQDCATKADFTRLSEELRALQDRMVELADKGARDFAEKFNSMGSESPEFIKEFDSAFAEFSNNAVAHFETLKQQYVQMLNDLIDKADELEANGHAPRMLGQVRALTDEVAEQIAVCDRAKEVWSGVYDDVSLDALDIVKQQRAEEEEKLKVLEQQVEVLRQQAEASQLSFSDRVGEAVTGSTAASDTHAEDVAAYEQANQALEMQKQVVAELRGEEEMLRESLSATAQAEVADSEAAAQASAERQAYIEKLRATRTEAQQTGDVLDGVVEKGSAAAQAIQTNSLQEGFSAAKERLVELEGELQSVLQQYKDAIAEQANLESQMIAGDQNVNVEDVEAARAKVEELRQGLEDTAYAYNNINAEVENYKTQIDESTEKQVSLRTQMRQAREDLARMVDAGKAGTPEFQKMAMEAGNLQRQFRMASASMQYFANPTRHLAALKTGLQGVAGAAGLVVGVMGLFNTESEKMQEIQTKVQSVMAVVVGLETAYGLAKKTSAIQMALSEVATLAEAAAKRVLAIGTTEATAAQEALNVAMAANPIGAVIAVVVALGAAIYALVSALSSAEEETTMTKGATEALSNAYDSQMKTTANQIATFQRLKEVYDESGGKADILKKKIIDNKKAQQDLGVTVKTVNDVHLLFAKNAQNFVNACIARGQALAAEAANAELLGKTMSELSKIFAKFRAGKEVNWTEVTATLKEIGMTEAQASDLLHRAGFGKEVNFWSKDDLIENEGFGNSLDEKIGDLYSGVTDYYYREGMGKVLNDMADRAWSSYEEATIDYNKLLAENQPQGGGGKGGGGKGGGGSSRSSSSGGGDKKEVDHSAADATDKLYEREEQLRKEAVEKRKRQLNDEIKAASTEQERAAKKQELADLETREFFRNKVMQNVAYAKRVYDEAMKDVPNKVSFYSSDIFKKFLTDADDELYPKLKEISLKAYETEMEIAQSVLNVQKILAEGADYDKSLKDLDQFLDKRVKTERKYDEKRAKLQELREKGAISEDLYKTYLSRVNQEEQAELNNASFKAYKNKPLFEVAMADTSMSYSQIKDIRDGMTDMMDKAMESAEPADFKGILDSYVKITEVMIQKNPFAVMKSSAIDLKNATDELNTETEKLNDLYTELGINAAGEQVAGGKLDLLEQAKDAAQTAKENAEEMVGVKAQAFSQALENVHAAELALEANTDPQQTEALTQNLTKAKAALKDSETELQNAEDERRKATEASYKADGEYYSTLDRVASQEKRVSKAAQKHTAAQNASSKATKKGLAVMHEWANALKEAASLYKSPISDAILGMVNLTTTTLDSIEAMKKSGYGAAKGVAKVAAAVQNAVAILAIIQAAWSVINTIIGLFQGEDLEQKQIDVLQAKVKALDYQFNKLKEDMDKAWGTEAIDAYSKALDALNAKQATSMEIIQAKASKSKSGFLGIGGHHSLEYQMGKIIGSNGIGGITNAELNAAKQLLQSLGVDTSKGNLLDWIYQLSPENLRTFMGEAAGNAVLAKLGAVTSSGDYQGSDWLSDLQNYANTAKDVENLTLEMAEKMNGISLDGLKDEFKSLVTTFDTSINDINKSFDSFMREGMYNKLRTGWDSALEGFYDELSDIKKQFDEGKMTEAQFRQAVQNLRNRFQQEVQNAQDEYQSSLTAAGINVTDIEQSGTSGGFETMSEDTASELNGRFASMQAMETITAETALQMLGQQTNIMNIADEIRTIQVNSLLELQSISENTRKIYNTVDDMQENVRTIKENTGRL